jgi:hypothetical protein
VRDDKWILRGKLGKESRQLIFVCVITFIFIRVAFGTLFGVNHNSKPDTTAAIAVAATTPPKK